MAGIRGLRDWANQHGTIVGALAIVIAVLVIFWSRWAMTPATPVIPTHMFFVDDITGDIVVEPVDAIPPLPGPDGRPTLVRGYFYTLGSDADKQLAYLEKYSDAGRAAMAARATATEPMDSPPETLVRAPKPGSPWVRLESPEGERVMSVLNDAAVKPGFHIVMPK